MKNRIMIDDVRLIPMEYTPIASLPPTIQAEVRARMEYIRSYKVSGRSGTGPVYVHQDDARPVVDMFNDEGKKRIRDKGATRRELKGLRRDVDDLQAAVKNILAFLEEAQK